MKFLFKLNHPAHYHLFKNVIKKLKSLEHDVIIVIKNKDILINLLDSNNIEYITLIESRKKSTKTNIIINNLLELIEQDFKLFNFVKQYKPDAMVGTDINIAHIGWLLNIPSYILNEDDIGINKLFCYFTYPFAFKIISPEICDVGIFKSKKTIYNGYQKLAYLHPNYFKPDYKIVEKYLAAKERYYLIRLVDFSAGHDIEKKHYGLNIELVAEIIELLEKNGMVFISSESKIPEQFIKYKLNINHLDIHHLIAFADLFISDSQSMTVEAAMLGTPSIRYNSFVGKISVLNELEEKYNLTFGINKDSSTLFDIITNIVSLNNSREIFQKRKNRMLEEKTGPVDILLNNLIKS